MTNETKNILARFTGYLFVAGLFILVSVLSPLMPELLAAMFAWTLTLGGFGLYLYLIFHRVDPYQPPQGLLKIFHTVNTFIAYPFYTLGKALMSIYRYFRPAPPEPLSPERDVVDKDVENASRTDETLTLKLLTDAQIEQYDAYLAAHSKVDENDRQDWIEYKDYRNRADFDDMSVEVKNMKDPLTVHDLELGASLVKAYATYEYQSVKRFIRQSNNPALIDPILRTSWGNSNIMFFRGLPNQFIEVNERVKKTLGESKQVATGDVNLPVTEPISLTCQ